jgi:cyclomaltodextrinase / maltogenic alpha-amylase / neopullulanase
MTVPYWVEDAIFYQIFPDRFANGDPAHILPGTLPWNSLPTVHGFQGGDLRGIIQKFDYLLDLGINALYLNPIFQATSTHRYNTTDYYQIDSKLGDLRDFRALLNVAHDNGVRVVLDGVFNHTGRGFFAFNDLVENQENSLYKDWFHVKRFPIQAHTPGEADDFEAWWAYKSLPKLNTTNPLVRRYIMNVARHWINEGADGWRLDVPNEIDDDDFWSEFRHVVKTANPDAYLLAEIWDGDPRWVGEKNFDGLMNYPIREALLQWLAAKGSVTLFADKVEKQLALYPRHNAYAMYLPVGSHDTERIWTALGGDIAKVKLAFLFQFTYPGAPAVYYGDETGVDGGKDPACRRTFQWDQKHWNLDLRDLIKRLIQLRKSSTALRRGDYTRIFVDELRGVFAFARTLGSEKALVVFNASPMRRNLRLPVDGLGWMDGRIVRDWLTRDEYIIAGSDLPFAISPWSGMILS